MTSLYLQSIMDMNSTQYRGLLNFINATRQATSAMQPPWIVQYPAATFTIAAVSALAITLLYKAIRNPCWRLRCVIGLGTASFSTLMLQALIRNNSRN